MESLRKWFYKPKKDDKSLLAQFFYADEALNIIASELDSFDGRKDPSRCTTLVNQLRQSQDKVLTITNAIMDVLIGDERANRDFRVKFPEDVLQENLAGQLWFGAECLAAGSSIMNKEAESIEMRPLAKAVTKSLENVRNLLRDTCLRHNIPNGPIKLDSNELVTEMLLESLKIFDKLFADFELAYVSAMVPVKTTQEYELQEFISVLFSETLQRSLKMRLLTQEMVDDCDPALMFTIPRLAIVSGLLIFPSGPLCIDRPIEEMSTMYRPFRTLLHKIRELLRMLTKRELYMLEKLLCDNEQFSVKSVSGELDDENNCDLDEFIDQFYSDYHVCKDNSTNFYNNNNNNTNCKVSESGGGNGVHSHPYYYCEETSATQRISSTIDIPSTSGYLIPNSIAHDIIVASISDAAAPAHGDRLDSPPDHDSLEVISVAAATLSSILTTTTTTAQAAATATTMDDDKSKVISKTDLESPNDSGVCTENTSLDRSPSLDCQCEGGAAREPTTNCKCSNSHRTMRNSPRKATRSTGNICKKTTISDYSPGTSKFAAGQSRPGGGEGSTLPVRKRSRIGRHIDEDSSSVGSSDTSSFNSNCADDEEIALAMHAAQIATRNEIRAKYKSSADLLHRLYVCIAGVADQLQTNFASDLRNILKAVFLINTSATNEVVETNHSSEGMSPTSTSPMTDSTSLETSLEYRPSEDDVIENNEFSVDPNILAQEALFDTNVYFHLDGENGTDDEYLNHPRRNQSDERNLASDLNRYASLREDFANLRQEQEQPEVQREREREQQQQQQQQEELATDRPPVWIPDVQAPKCMSCGANFSVVKRRHHCRNCGKVFCARCSSNSVPLPKFGHHKPVRVCNRCFIYNLTPFTM